MDGYYKKMRVWEVLYAKAGDPVSVGQVQAADFEGALKVARTFQPRGFKIASLICTGLVRETLGEDMPEPVTLAGTPRLV